MNSAKYQKAGSSAYETYQNGSPPTNTSSSKDVESQKPYAVSSWRLIALVKPELSLIFIGCIALAVSSAAQMALPTYAGHVIDAVSVQTEESRANLNRAILYMVAFFVLAAFFTFVRYTCFTLAGYKIVTKLRNDLFQAILKQEIGFFDANRTGELINRLSSDAGVLQNALTTNVSMVLRLTAQMFVGLLLLFWVSWRLTLLMLSVLPVVIITALVYGRFIKKYSAAVQDALAKAGTISEESISNVRTVRSFSKEIYEWDKYDTHVTHSYELGRTSTYASGVFTAVAFLCISLAIALVLWYGGTLVLSGAMTAGTLTTFILYTITVSVAAGALSSLYGDFMKAVGASSRIFELIDRQPLVKFRGGVRPANFKGNIVYDDVKFSYPTRSDVQVLRGLNLTCSPGKVVALVGPSGGGKSTIVALLEAFYYPEAGRISIDGIDIRDIDIEYLHERVGLVSQEPVLFDGTIAENISYSSGHKVSIDSVIEAAKHANAHGFISELPDGYDTLVGERGVRLSGGQKQRVAIARAVLRDPAILLLDEATSALDAESEYLVKTALDKLMKGRTVIVIAHRLSTVKNADHVVVIDKGVVVQKGTHSELMADSSGLYAMLVQRQLQRDEQPAPEKDLLVNI